MENVQAIAALVYLGMAIVAGVQGEKRSCGFMPAFLLSLVLTPITGFFLVLSSERRPLAP